jgi:glycosyltransferase involved in cell wall biosynthesis
MVEPQRATMCWLSNFVRERVVAATGWVPEHETVTYSGVDPADFPLATVSERGWSGRLLAVGRVEPRKGFTAAVQALVDLPDDVTLHIVGPDDGNHRQQLADLARELGVRARVSFSTSPRSELRKVYQAADALLFTSAWEEPFGLVPVEAMACGVPVVAAATGGAREYLVDEVNSLVVPPRDPAALADAVRRLAGHPALRKSLVQGGLRTAAEFSVDKLADVLEQWHLAAVGDYASGEPPHRSATVAR